MKTLKNYSPKTKVLSLILSFLIVFYLIPVSVYAEGLNIDTTVPENPVSANEEASTYTPPIYEVTELREENVKHFRLEDGSYVAAQYNYPVHYTDENGRFIDIDNRLIDSGSELSTSNSRVKFVKKITGNGNIYTLHENNTKITVGLVGAEKKTEGVVTSTNNSDDSIEDTLGKMTNLENISSTILYDDILDGVDIEYVVHSLNIKENIIVKERRDSYSYTFTIELNNLTATLADDGNVYINSADGETKYIIPAPIVFDANDEFAPKNVSGYTLTSSGNGKYELTVTVSSDWMNADNRAFPVTIDPAMLSPGGAVVDLSIDSGSPDSNQNNTFGFYISSTQRAYLKFDENYFTTLPVGTSIMKAELTLKGSALLSGSAKIGVYPITSDWDATLTWNKTISATPEGSFGESPLDYTIVDRTDTRYSWDITSLYKDWLNGETNYGVGLRLIDETSSSYACFSCYENTSTSDYRKPAIMVTYIHNDGLESYYPTATHSAGAGGVGSINLSTGRLTFAIPTLTTTDSLFAFTPTLVYNSSLAGKDVTSEHVDIPFATSYMPKGFKLNIQETIVKKNYKDENNATHYYYVLYDADGTTHNFFSDDNTNYYDDSGLRLALTLSDGDILIEDTSHTVRTYSKINSSSWHLTSITDKYENQLIFEFNDSYQPTAVKVEPNGLSEIEMLNLLYENDKLVAVYNPASKDSVILTYSNGNLYMMKHCYGNDNTTEQDVRDTYNNLSSAKNVTAYATTMYDTNSNGYIFGIENLEINQDIWYEIEDGKIINVSEYGSNYLGQEVSYTYGEGYTDVRSTGNDESLNTTDDIINRYVFDKYGRSVSAYSMSANGSEIYGATTGIYETSYNTKSSLKETTTWDGSSVNYIANGGFDGNLMYWTTSGSVSCALSDKFTGVKNLCASFSPTPDSQASIKHRLYLASDDYTLSLHINSAKAENITASVTIVDMISSRVISSEKIALNNGSTENITVYSKSFFVSPYVNGESRIEITISFSAAGTVSTDNVLQVDMINLERGVDFGKYSEAKYGSFETSSFDISNNRLLDPYFFWDRDDSNGVITEATGTPFYTSAKVSTNVGEDGYIKQRIFEATSSELSRYDNQTASAPYESNATLKYLVSGFAKAENALNSSYAEFCLKVVVAYYQGSGNDDVEIEYVFDYIPSIATWQFTGGYVDTHISVASSSVSYECVKSIDIYCVYSGHYDSYAYFDNISVVSSESNHTEYSYNESGLVTKKQSGQYIEYYDYNGNNDVSIVANSNNELIEYEYYIDTATEQLTSRVKYLTRYTYVVENGQDYSDVQANSATIVKTLKSRTKYLYNAYGLPTKVETYDEVAENGNKVVESKSYYECYSYIIDSGSKIFGAVSYFWDSTGTNIRYFYDESKGHLKASVNSSSGSNIGLNYTYDEQGRLIKVIPAKYLYTYEHDFSVTENAEKVEYTYDSANRLESIVTASTTYTFDYDAFGNSNSVTVGNKTLATYEYYENNGKIKKINYGNGFSEEYVYNTLEMLSEIWYTYDDGTREKAYSYEYTSSGELYRFTDHLLGTYTVYRYDGKGRLLGANECFSSGEEMIYFSSYSYDDNSRLTEIMSSFSYSSNGTSCDEVVNSTYQYDESSGLLSEEFITTSQFAAWLEYAYDSFDRLSSVEYLLIDLSTDTGIVNRDEYSYYELDDLSTSHRVSEFNSTIGNDEYNYSYTYDSDGNITEINSSNAASVTYVYDDIGQLIRETQGQKTLHYTYDNAGNITSIRTETPDTGGDGFITYALTPILPLPVLSEITLSYTDSEWGDLLTSYDGTTITYDEIGNPLSYYNGSAYTFTWEGRKLVTATTGSKSMSFTYNDEGIRTSKTVNGVTHTYYLNGSQITAEEWEDKLLVYLYDASGAPIGMMYRTTSYDIDEWDTFFFEKNLQGDIVAVYNSDGAACITYKYDAWGNFKESYIGNSPNAAWRNPFRYRGYYYDTDLGMYYLQSRYYDAKICRFINADGQLNTDHILGTNLYAYCYNNPVMYVDPTGYAPDWWLLFEGSMFVFMGVLTVAAVISTGGSCLPLVQLAYIALATAGAIATTIGASEINESLTGYNPVKDSVGEQSYDTLKYGSLFVMSMGASIIEYGTSFSVCFVAGTLVKAAEGDIPIESIQVGDYVYAHNPETGETELKLVVNTFVNEATELVHVFTDGEEIICTNEHPFYSPVKGWTEACKLRAGDILVSVNGEYIVVEQVQHEILEAPIKVYNFEVEDFHTYFVGAGDGVLVHNSCNHNSSWNTERINHWKTESTKAEVGRNYGSYIATEDNISRMSRGLAPIGWDGYSVQLHHPNGITNDFYNYYPVSRTFHIFLHGKD